jgi:hypothetical protein
MCQGFEIFFWGGWFRQGYPASLVAMSGDWRLGKEGGRAFHPNEQKRSSGTPVRTMPTSQNRDYGAPGHPAQRGAGWLPVCIGDYPSVVRTNPDGRTSKMNQYVAE